MCHALTAEMPNLRCLGQYTHFRQRVACFAFTSSPRYNSRIPRTGADCVFRIMLELALLQTLEVEPQAPTHFFRVRMLFFVYKYRYFRRFAVVFFRSEGF